MLHFKQNRLNLFIYFQVIPSPAAWSMKLQWDHMYLLQCGLLCVGSTLELRFQGRLLLSLQRSSLEQMNSRSFAAMPLVPCYSGLQHQHNNPVNKPL